MKEYGNYPYIHYALKWEWECPVCGGHSKRPNSRSRTKRTVVKHLKYCSCDLPPEDLLRRVD